MWKSSNFLQGKSSSIEAEAYWGLVLCRYGIEYVNDPATGKKVPTCHRQGNPGEEYSVALFDQGVVHVLAVQDLLRGIDKFFPKQQIEDTTLTSERLTDVSAFMRRGKLHLEIVRFPFSSVSL